jgi:hypothetical protein
MLLIGLFTLTFFQIGDNIRFGYLLGVVMMLLAVISLIIWYKRIIAAEKK